MYVCGPTVQSSPHIGHLRSALVYDIMRRWFTHRGYEVTFVRNVTDIDDKILQASADDTAPVPEEWWARAYRVELEFSAAYASLGILPPSYEPRATASIQTMHELIATLIDRGHAYVAPDASGDVYFDTASWADYGSFTRQSRDKMEAATDTEARAKRDPRDFALWKGQKAHEPESATWSSPWGPGRPGWHLECSAMASRYLGTEFDVHGGGLDLRFPHHENELAQSNAAGHGYARYWVHNGLVTIGGQKMSKSLGNSVFVADLFRLASPLAVRYYLAAAHYRSVLDYSPAALVEATSAVERLSTFLDRVARQAGSTSSVTGTDIQSHRSEALGLPAHPVAVADGVTGMKAAVSPHEAAAPTTPPAEPAPPLSSATAVPSAAPVSPVPVPAAFAAALDSDFGMPEALAVLHETVRRGNQALDSADLAAAMHADTEVTQMLGVLGLDPRAPQWNVAAQTPSALGFLVERLLTERQSARECRDFVAADRIRDTLAAAGITIEDTNTGTHWSLDT